MPAARRDASLVEHQDQVSGMNRAQTVRDHKGRAAIHHPLQSGLYQMLGLAVHTGCGIIEDQDAGIGQQGAGDGLSLIHI